MQGSTTLYRRLFLVVLVLLFLNESVFLFIIKLQLKNQAVYKRGNHLTRTTTPAHLELGKYGVVPLNHIQIRHQSRLIWIFEYKYVASMCTNKTRCHFTIQLQKSERNKVLEYNDWLSKRVFIFFICILYVICRNLTYFFSSIEIVMRAFIQKLVWDEKFIFYQWKVCFDLTFMLCCIHIMKKLYHT